MEIKLLALDLDGTLLNSQEVISEENLKAVKAVRKKGVTVTLATGRPYSSALKFADILNITVPLITYNGALIRFGSNGDILQHYPVPNEYTPEIIRTAEKYDVHLNLYIDDILYAAEENEMSALYKESTGMETKPVGNLLDFFKKSGRPTTKALAIEKSKEIMEEFSSELKKKMDSKLHITSSKDFYLEIMNKEVSKGRALKKVCSRLDIPLENTAAVGDNYNDLDMILCAGLGAAVSSAQLDIKEKADYVVPSNDEHGISSLIYDKILI